MAEPVAVAWFPRTELLKALALWPGMIDWEFTGHAEYSLRIEDRLRELSANGLGPLSVAPIVVDELIDWAVAHERDPAEAHTRAKYAAVLLQRERALAWPPSRQETCWCGSGQSYGSCCGRLRPV